MTPSEPQKLKKSTVISGPDVFGSVTRPLPRRAPTTHDRQTARRSPLLETTVSNRPTGQPGPNRPPGPAFSLPRRADPGPARPVLGGDRSGSRPGRSRTAAVLAVVVAALTIGTTLALVNFGPDDETAAGLGQDVDRVVAGAPEQSLLPTEGPEGERRSVEGLTLDSDETPEAPSTATSTPEATTAAASAAATTAVGADGSELTAAETAGSKPETASTGGGAPSSADTTASAGPGRPATSATPVPGRGSVTSGPATSARSVRSSTTAGATADRPARTTRRTTEPSPTTAGRATTSTARSATARPPTGQTITTRRTTTTGRTTTTRRATTGPSATAGVTTTRPTTATAGPTTATTRPTTATTGPTTATTRPTTATTPSTTTSTTTTTTGGSSGRVVWEEQFNSLDTGTWRIEHSTYGDGNNELQCYRPENVSVANGKLVLRAVTETYTCPNGSTRQVTSGMIRSRGVTFSPGQAIEFRVKLNPANPDDQGGLWPAVWASGWAGGGWPRGGEMDWLEVMTAENPRRAMFSMHYADASGNHALQNKGVIGSQYFSAAWHVIRFDYGRNGELTWYLDGVEAFRVDSASTVQGYPAPFDQTVGEIKINLALGGRPGPLAPGAVGSQGASFEMDYIRILEL